MIVHHVSRPTPTTKIVKVRIRDLDEVAVIVRDKPRRVERSGVYVVE